MKSRPPIRSIQYRGHWIYEWPYHKFTVLNSRIRATSLEDAKSKIDRKVSQ